MKEQIKVLVKIQHLDTESVRIKSTLNDVSKKLENLDSSLKEIEQTIKDQESVLNELKKQYRDYESDVKMNLVKNKKSQAFCAQLCRFMSVSILVFALFPFHLFQQWPFGLMTQPD